MSLILVYDVETSGLPLFDQPSEDPRQPHICQLAACLVDTDTRKTIQSIDLIIRPDGWEIPDEVAKIHGITTEYAKEVGVDEIAVISLFLVLWRASPASCVRIGHNEAFDARLIRIALKRFSFSQEMVDAWKRGKAECTAKLATPYCKLPPTDKMKAVGRNHYKTCKLEEAYQAFFRRPMLDAHSAMGDVQACMAVYWKIKDMEDMEESVTREDTDLQKKPEEDFQV